MPLTLQRSLYFRFREWLAERYRWAQFPRQRFIPKRPAPPFFKVPMHWEQRGLLTLFGSLAIAIGIVVLAFVALLGWAILKV